MQQACARLGVTEAELAQILGVDRQRLWNWKNYRRRIPGHALDKLVNLASGGLTEKIVGLRAETVGHYTIEWMQRRCKDKRKAARQQKNLRSA